VVCDYARAKRPKVPFPYFAEVFTGLEYATAALMMAEGMVDAGLEMVRNIRRRYDGERRNAWNEAECGNHYARAMASWSPIVILSGFDYDGAGRRLTVRPRYQAADFRSFWSTASGWGTFAHRQSQDTTKLSLTIDHGSLRVASVELDHAGKPARVVSALLNGAKIGFPSDLGLKADDRLEITARLLS